MQWALRKVGGLMWESRRREASPRCISVRPPRPAGSLHSARRALANERSALMLRVPAIVENNPGIENPDWHGSPGRCGIESQVDRGWRQWSFPVTVKLVQIRPVLEAEGRRWSELSVSLVIQADHFKVNRLVSCFSTKPVPTRRMRSFLCPSHA